VQIAIDEIEHPFLLSGCKVMDGCGDMIVSLINPQYIYIFQAIKFRTYVSNLLSLPITTNYKIIFINSRKFVNVNWVIRKVTWLGGENGKLRHNRASKAWLGMKSLQNEVTGTQTSFSTNFGGKLSFILPLLFQWAPPLQLAYIYFHCSYLYNYYNYTRTLCIKCWVSAFHTES